MKKQVEIADVYMFEAGYESALDDAIEAVEKERREYTLPVPMMALDEAIAAIEKLRRDKE